MCELLTDWQQQDKIFYRKVDRNNKRNQLKFISRKDTRTTEGKHNTWQEQKCIELL